MASRSAHGITGMLVVVPLFMGSLGAAHAIDDDTLMHVLGHRRQAFTDLDAVSTGGDALGIAHGISARHTAKGIQMGHASRHVQINDVARSRHLLGFRASFKGSLCGASKHW